MEKEMQMEVNMEMFATKTHDLHMTPVEADETETTDEAVSDEELRRQMYERIAQGHAMSEAEDHARRKWQGR